MITVNIGEAKDRFSELVRRAESGEEVVIARDGAPVVALRRHVPERIPGRLKGKFVVPADFDDPLPDEILNQFYNGPVFPDVDPEPTTEAPA